MIYYFLKRWIIVGNETDLIRSLVYAIRDTDGLKETENRNYIMKKFFIFAEKTYCKRDKSTRNYKSKKKEFKKKPVHSFILHKLFDPDYLIYLSFSKHAGNRRSHPQSY